jgi:hypothetical protein
VRDGGRCGGANVGEFGVAGPEAAEKAFPVAQEDRRQVDLHLGEILGAPLVAGLLPVWHGEDPSNIGLVLAGVAAMTIGVLDHRHLASETSG